MATPDNSYYKRFKRKRLSGLNYDARYRIDRRKSFPRDANGLEPIEAYFSSEEDDTSFDYSPTPAKKTVTPSRPKFTGTSSLTPRPPTTPNASSSPAAATKTVNTPRDQSVHVSPKQTLSKSRKKRKKITCSTGPRKQPARQSISKEVESPVRPVTPTRGTNTEVELSDTASPVKKTFTPTRLTFSTSSSSPRASTTSTRASTRTATKTVSNSRPTFTAPTSSPSPQAPPTSTRASPRTTTRTADNSSHTFTTAATSSPTSTRASTRTTTKTVKNSRVSTTSRSTRKDSPSLIIDSIASPSRTAAAPVDHLANVSPLKTVAKTRKKRKKITCPPLPRRQPAKRTITEIKRKSNVTPGVRRTKRPNISRVPAGGYVEYKQHWGNTPSNTYGPEALHIVNPIPSPSPRRSANNKRLRDEEEFYVSLASPDDPENFVRHHVLFPLSHGQLCNVDGVDLQPGDDVIINRVIGTDNYQRGQMDLKRGAEKPMAQNGNCDMVFRVLKGKMIAVLEDKEVEVCTDEYILIPPGTAYQLNNISRSNTVIDYTVIMKMKE